MAESRALVTGGAAFSCPHTNMNYRLYPRYRRQAPSSRPPGQRGGWSGGPVPPAQYRLLWWGLGITAVAYTAFFVLVYVI